MCVFVCAMEGIGEDTQPEMPSLSTVSIAQSQQYMSDQLWENEHDVALTTLL